jgi:tetrahydromethanopterin S-methyltransferase subunit B
LYCEMQIQDKMGTIDKVKEKITKLEEMADMEEMMDDDADEPIEMFDDEGKPIKVKLAKKKMCESIRKTGKCKNTAKTCKYAHSAIELELIGSQTKINNLQNVVRCLNQTMRTNKTSVDWFPPSHGGIEDRKKFKLNR